MMRKIGRKAATFFWMEASIHHSSSHFEPADLTPPPTDPPERNLSLYIIFDTSTTFDNHIRLASSPSKCHSEAKRRRLSSSRKVRFTPPPARFTPRNLRGRYKQHATATHMIATSTDSRTSYRNRYLPRKGTDHLQHQCLSRCSGYHQVHSGSLRR